MIIIDPSGLLTKTQIELEEEYNQAPEEQKRRETKAYQFWSKLGIWEIAQFFGAQRYETIGLYEWALNQGYSDVIGDNNVRYFYLNFDWDQGGDVITDENGVSYIHHDSTYTLIQLPRVQGRRGITHSFDHPYDPNGILDSDRMNPTFVRSVKKLIFLYHIQDRENALRIVEGYRTWETQQRYYAQGRTVPGRIITNARPGFSWHQYGVAVDIVFQNANGGPSWSNNHPWNNLGRVGQQAGLEWGGTWKFRDLPHFQLTNYTRTYQAYNIYINYINNGYTIQQALEAVWRAMGL